MKSLSPVEADIYIDKIAKNYHISAGALRTEMGIGQDKETVFKTNVVDDLQNESIDITRIEQSIIKVILTDSKYFDEAKKNDDIFVSQTGINIFKEIENIYNHDEEIDLDKLIENLEPGEVQAIKYIENNISLGGKADAIFKECIKSHNEERLVNKEKEIIMQLSIADEQNNPEEIKRLTEALMQIQKEKSLGGNK